MRQTVLLVAVLAIVAASSASARLDSTLDTTAKTSGNVVSDGSERIFGLVWGGGGGVDGGVYGSDTSGLNETLITAFPRLRGKYGWDEYFDPTWSRTGRRLAYATSASATALVHVFTKATRQGVTLAAPTGQAIDPAWAPDEDRLAYYNFPRNPIERGGYISVVSLNSGRSRVLIAPQPGRRDQEPTWSADGKTIAFVREKLVPDPKTADGFRLSDGVIHLVSATGRGLRRLTAGRAPDWSPDGERILFAGNDGVYIIGPDGRGRRRLVRVPQTATRQLNPKWSPNGTTIMYVVDGEEATTVWTMDAEGTHRKPIHKAGESTSIDVGWDPDWR